MNEESDGQQRSSSVRAVERAGRIITALADHPYPMSVTELAARVMLSPASVHRLLTTLVGMGWVDQNGRTLRYRLGTRMLGIGSTGLVTNPVIQNGKAFLVRLSSITGFDAVLSTLVGLRVVHLARVQGSKGPAFQFEAGISQPAHAMADGKLLLAHLPPAERLYLFEADGLRSYTDRTIVDVTALEKELVDTMRRGYAVDRSERFEGVFGLAVPVLGFDDKPILAMLTIGRKDESAEYEEWLAQQMLSLAREMADQLIVVGDMPKPSNDFARFNLV